MSAIGAILVRSWRCTFTGLVPPGFLDSLSPQAQQQRHERTFAREGVCYRVAVCGGKVVGFASAGPSRDADFSTCDELYAIYLLPEQVGWGIGRRLFESVVEGLTGTGDRGLYVTVLSVNPHRGFYVRLGGREIAGPPVALGETSLSQSAFFWDRLPIAAR